MPSIGQRFKLAVASAAIGLAGLSTAGHSVAASVNVLPDNYSSITTNVTDVFGVLRVGSPWTPGGLADLSSILDGNFLLPGTVWNQGTRWWDEDPSVNRAPVMMFIQLTSTFVLDRFVLQGDNNDVYQIDWWDGAAWLPAYTAPLASGAGMRTRDSGLLAPITTDLLRIMAVGGDNYYSISEIQAFGTATVIPVPGALLLFATGAGAFGLFARRRRSA
jgi:hypothetical protein